MNQKQKYVLIGIVVVIVGMFLFPPFHIIARDGSVHNMGYSWLFDPPAGGRATVNVGLLLTQWVAVLLIGGLSFFILHGSDEKSAINSSTSKKKMPKKSLDENDDPFSSIKALSQDDQFSRFAYIKDGQTVMVKKGFNWWALLWPGLWSIYKGFWGKGVVAIVFPAGVYALNPFFPALISLLIGLFYGFKGNGWVRRDLEKKGFLPAGDKRLGLDDPNAIQKPNTLNKPDEQQSSHDDHENPFELCEGAQTKDLYYLRKILLLFVFLLVVATSFLGLKKGAEISELRNTHNNLPHVSASKQKQYQHTTPNQVKSEFLLFDELRSRHDWLRDVEDEDVIRAVYENAYQGDMTLEEFERHSRDIIYERERQYRSINPARSHFVDQQGTEEDLSLGRAWSEYDGPLSFREFRDALGFEPERTVGGQAREFVKGVGRGFGQTFASVPKGMSVLGAAVMTMALRSDKAAEDRFLYGVGQRMDDWVYGFLEPDADYAKIFMTRAGEIGGLFGAIILFLVIMVFFYCPRLFSQHDTKKVESEKFI